MARPAQTHVENRATTLLGLALAGTLAVMLLVLTPAAKAGLGSMGPAEVCGANAVQPFASWNDESDYVLVPGASFEAGAPGWNISGARIVSGNEWYFVNGLHDSRSLFVPRGASVTTPSMCFAPGDWHLRLFAFTAGPSSSYLKVSVLVRSSVGVLTILDGGKVPSTGSWQPSPRLHLPLTEGTSLIGPPTVSFRFTPVGLGSDWRIDDIYLDPFKSH